MTWLALFMASFLFPIMLLVLLVAMDWRKQMVAERNVNRAAPRPTSSRRREP